MNFGYEKSKKKRPEGDSYKSAAEWLKHIRSNGTIVVICLDRDKFLQFPRMKDNAIK